MLKNNSIFKKCNVDMIKVSNHFLERWNERIKQIKFTTKNDLENYIKRNYNKSNVYKLDKDQYLMDGILGGIYITAIKDKDKIMFITTLGTYNDNPVLYNIISSGKKDEIFEKYGKMNLSYAI